MFLTIALIYPLNKYAVKSGNVFPSLDIIVFSFAWGYIFLFFQNFFSDKKEENRQQNLRDLLKHQFSLKGFVDFVSSYGLISFLNLLISLFFQQFRDSNEVLCTIIVFGVAYALQTKVRKAKQLIGLTSLLPAIFLSIRCSGAIPSAFVLLESLVISLVLNIINSGVSRNSYKELQAGEVKAGMILSFGTILQMQHCTDLELPKATTETRRTRLSKSQADAVNRWATNSRRNVLVVEMLPFAPFIAISVLTQVIRSIIVK